MGRIKLFTALVLSAWLVFTGSASAITAEQLDLYSSGINFYDSEGSPGCNLDGGTVLTGNNNAEIVWNYFLAKGMEEIHIAGFMGNFEWESDFDPTTINEVGAFGLAQWLRVRKTALFAYAEGRGESNTDLGLQLDYTWYELTGEGAVEGVVHSEQPAYQAIIQATTVEEAAELVFSRYERPLDDTLPERTELAIKNYDLFASGTSGSLTSVCRSGGLGISVDGFVFPLLTSKTALAEGSAWPDDGRIAVWCEDALTSCHGQYPAADIFVAPNVTAVVASRDGTVTAWRDRIGGVGSRVSVYNAEEDIIYYYAHMKYNSLLVSPGETVQAGDVIGYVGEAAQAVNTAPHLHFDMTIGNGRTTRVSCTRTGTGNTPPCLPTYEGIFIDPQPFLAESYRSLPE